MSDDEVDLELLELLRKSLGISSGEEAGVPAETGVLEDAKYIYNNAIDVSVDMYGTKGAATSLYKAIKQRNYCTQAWSEREHKLYPKLGQDVEEVGLVNFIFTMSLLNFSFWTDLLDEERYQVEYKNRRWTDNNSLAASLRRALDEGIPVTTPRFWHSEACSDVVIERVFRSATDEKIPLLEERIDLLREAADVLQESFDEPDEEDEDQFAAASNEGDGSNAAESTAPSTALSEHTDDVRISTVQSKYRQSLESGTTLPNLALADSTSQAPDLSVVRLIKQADHSAGRLANLLAKHFPSFRDETRFDGRKVRLLKRAQSFVADLWAAFQGEGYGEFNDIGHLTIFADYRVPQMLHSLGVLVYSPPLDTRIRRLQALQPGEGCEVQLRGCSIWAVELIRRHIVATHADAGAEVNSVLLGFLLYDLAKEREAAERADVSGEYETTSSNPLPHATAAPISRRANRKLFFAFLAYTGVQ